MLADLRPIEREILVLRFVDELSFAEIAEVLGLGTDEACRSRCRRALQSAHKRLRQHPVFSRETG